MLTALLTQFGPWIVGIIGVIVGLLGMKAKSTADGKRVAAETIAKEREKIAADSMKKADAANEKETKAVQNANDAIASVNGLGDAAASSELRKQWTRD